MKGFTFLNYKQQNYIAYQHAYTTTAYSTAKQMLKVVNVFLCGIKIDVEKNNQTLEKIDVEKMQPGNDQVLDISIQLNGLCERSI